MKNKYDIKDITEFPKENVLNMQPFLEKNDKEMFYKYLDKISVYFEFGSGGSTYQASIRQNITKIYSVESDKTWHYKLQKCITNNKITYIFNEMNTQPNTLGRPGPNSTKKQKISYSNQILNLTENEQTNIDLILIDGRFRVSCCLKCFNVWWVVIY